MKEPGGHQEWRHDGRRGPNIDARKHLPGIPIVPGVPAAPVQVAMTGSTPPTSGTAATETRKSVE